MSHYYRIVHGATWYRAKPSEHWEEKDYLGDRFNDEEAAWAVFRSMSLPTAGVDVVCMYDDDDPPKYDEKAVTALLKELLRLRPKHHEPCPVCGKVGYHEPYCLGHTLVQSALEILEG